MAYTRNEFLTNLLRSEGNKMSDYNVAKDMDPNMVVDDFSAPSMPLQPSRNMARIAEIDRRLEEIKKEQERWKNGGLEEAMGQYKYLYDSDPSTYMSYKQNMRNAEQTEKIRKATEDATKASNAQTAWKQLLIDEEAEMYNLAAIQNGAQQALESGNKTGYINAKNDEARAVAKLSRIAKEKDMYKKKFANQLGIADGEYERSAEVVYDDTKDNNLVQLGNLEQLVADIGSETDKIRQRPESMQKVNKNELVGNAQQKLAEFRKRLEGLKGTLSPTRYAELENSINAFEDSIPKFKKGQTVKLTKETFARMAAPQLVKLGKRVLLKYKNQGWTNQYLDKAIAAAK